MYILVVHFIFDAWLNAKIDNRIIISSLFNHLKQPLGGSLSYYKICSQ